MEIDCFLISLLLLNSYHFLYCVNNIKSGNNFPKFIGFDLRIIQQILDGEMH